MFIYLLNCLLLCARFVVQKYKYCNRIPKASEIHQKVQKIKLSKFILSKKHNKINFFRKKNGRYYSEFIKQENESV